METQTQQAKREQQEAQQRTEDASDMISTICAKKRCLEISRQIREALN